MKAKLEEHSWRTLAIKLASNITKLQSGALEPKDVQKYIDAITHKLNIENGYYLEDSRSNSESDAPVKP